MGIITSNLLTQNRRTERGAILVELALIAPLLIILLGGAVDLGLLFRENQQLIEAVRVGGRTVSSYSPSSAYPGDELCRVAKHAILNSFGESNIGEIFIHFENADLNSDRLITSAGVIKAVKISVERNVSTRPTFFQNYLFQSGAAGTYYLQSQIDVATECSL